MRYALGIEYDGSEFFGWQIQADGRTVQGELEKALSSVADHPITVQCAGRTDSGVHGREQVVHFDTAAKRDLRSWLLGTNAGLSEDICLRWVKEVPQQFHARFSARARHYEYRICNRHSRPALDRNRVAWTHRTLDVRRMQVAADALLGEHDFTSFRAAGCQAKHANRYLYLLKLQQVEDCIVLDVVANAFLHHMVRNIAGVLMAIGRGDEEVDWTKRLLGARDRTLGGVTAPPQGLYLMGVYYPPEFDIPWSAEKFGLSIKSIKPVRGRKSED